MKTISLLAGSLLLSFIATAQSAPSTPENLMPSTLASNLPAPFNQPGAKYIGQNTMGNIYAMPDDNMPCLVTPVGRENSMPVYITPLTGTTMPNAITKQQPFTLPFNRINSLRFNKAPKEVPKNLMLDLIRKK